MTLISFISSKVTTPNGNFFVKFDLTDYKLYIKHTENDTEYHLIEDIQHIINEHIASVEEDDDVHEIHIDEDDGGDQE